MQSNQYHLLPLTHDGVDIITELIMSVGGADTISNLPEVPFRPFISEMTTVWSVPSSRDVVCAEDTRNTVIIGA